jgi:hypothetical protein
MVLSKNQVMDYLLDFCFILNQILTHQRTPTRIIKRVTPAVILSPMSQIQFCDERSTIGGICVSS